jgi:hypothetical protein
MTHVGLEDGQIRQQVVVLFRPSFQAVHCESVTIMPISA